MADVYTMILSKIASKARELAKVGLFEQALNLLKRNAIIYEIFPNKVEVKLPKGKKQKNISF